MTQYQIMNEALEQMPDYFSSKLFCRVARKLGIDEETIQGNHTLNFLKRKTTKGDSRSTWVKKEKRVVVSANPKGIVTKLFEDYPSQKLIDLTKDDDEWEKSCINYLKSKGYKIMKPVNEFQEV